MIIIEFIDGEVEEFGSGYNAMRNLAPRLKKGIKETYDLPNYEDFIKDNLKDIRKILDKYKIKEEKEESK